MGRCTFFASAAGSTAHYPHNFKLTVRDVRRATFLPRKWLLSLFRRHHARLVIEVTNDRSQKYHFEQLEGVCVAYGALRDLLGDKATVRFQWDEALKRFIPGGE